MVRLVVIELSSAALLAEETGKAVLDRLDPPRRAAVVMALLALVLTGMLLVTFAMLGGHWVRRMARHKPRTGHAKVNSGAENRQLRESLQAILPNAKSSETIHVDRTGSDTRADT